MLNIALLTAAGFTDESFDTGTFFMCRDLQQVIQRNLQDSGNLTIHSKAFVSCHSSDTVNAWQAVNVYSVDGNRHLCEYVTPEDERTFTSTEEALSALGFDVGRLRQLKKQKPVTLKLTASGELHPLPWFEECTS